MGKARLDPLNTVSFHCRACGHRFKAPPAESVAAPDLDYHPFVYLAPCPKCDADAEQAPWERSLLKAHANATGPRTAEGKAASAKNLEGHPTPEEAKLTRFNAVKHALYARTATYFPAKPGKYGRCEGCEHMETLACLEPPRACIKRYELMLRHQIAFESGDSKMLMQIRSDTQAGIQGLIDDMILAIAQDGGPRIKSPEWYHDKDGNFHLAEFTDAVTGELIQLQKLEAHPLLKLLMDYISKNSMTLADMGMTPKVQDDHDQLQGYLDKENSNQEEEAAYRDRMLEGQKKLAQLIGNSHSVTRDPVTVEGEVVHDS